jgi:hypothetical protein
MGLPGPPVHRLHRRRRPGHADSRAGHRRPLQPADHRDRQQQRLPRPDRVGAGRPRLPRVRGPLRAQHRLRQGRRGVRRPPGSGSSGPATSGPRSGPPSTMPALPWSTVTSTPTSPRFPATSSSRPRASPRRSCAASPTSSPPPGPCSRTRSTSSAADLADACLVSLGADWVAAGCHATILVGDPAAAGCLHRPGPVGQRL